MPDWFYRPVSRPILFRMPAVAARDLALGLMGKLARLPLGPALIDFLGHMRADPRLQRSFLGITFPTVLGLGPALDVNASALPALARFGFGFLEVGPIQLEEPSKIQAVERRPEQHALWYADRTIGLGLNELTPRLIEASRLGIPIIARLGYANGATPEQAATECQRLIQALSSHAHLFSLRTPHLALAGGWSEGQWAKHAQIVLDAARSASPARRLLLCVSADLESTKADALIGPALAAGAGGVLIDGCVGAPSAGYLVGSPAREPALELVRHIRQRWGKDILIVGSGGIHEPEEALQFRAAGADLIQVDSGLVYSGPGLPKRINDALLFAVTRLGDNGLAADSPLRPAEMTWFWTMLLGAGMFIGSLLALVIAATQVVLPYDEAFIGLSRDKLPSINPRLLAFMTHDRVTLAGTMVAIGILYLGLSLFGIQRGLHWAQLTVFISAFTGFASFFLFLGFGYLDLFHAFVTAVLLQLLLMAVHSRLGTYQPTVPPLLREDWSWRYGQWGQLILILHSCGLLAAGLTISGVGVTKVFVPEDLEFMDTTAEALRSANDHLVPLVAHDRATFGGMLLASGWAFLLPMLWGFRNGLSWLWWTFLLAGASAYAAAIGVHYAVGYTHFGHLLPAFMGLGVFLLGLALSYPYLCGAAGCSGAVQWKALPQCPLE